uniref:Exocyst complex component Sec10 n=1 Tax=Rhabditophanes sp. KR3021 TaxID=114890 RepID=A0AC35TJS8_9BILA
MFLDRDDFVDTDYSINASEVIDTYVEQFNQNLKKAGAKVAKYWQTFSGNNVFMVLEKLDQLFLYLDRTEKMKRFRLVFEALRDVKKLAKSKTLSEDEKKATIQSIKAFRETITYPLLKLTMQPKAYFLISHMPEQIEKYASMNFFSEQSIESMHTSINKDMFKVTS